MVVRLKPETEAKLTARAEALGLTVADYLESILDNSFQIPDDSGRTQFQKEHGLWVYRTGHPMPAALVDDTIESIRREREEGFLADLGG